MKIAFVGKGGAGKTTFSALFAAYLAHKSVPTVAIDADLNMHLGELLGFSPLEEERHISYPAAAKHIQEILRGTNGRIKALQHFRKTTPPGAGSHIIRLSDTEDPILKNYSDTKGPLRFMVVGTYSDDGIGTSCYHNNLAILENILSHSYAAEEAVVVDMVAGIDAFAGTLHSQFDLLVLIVEPTRRSVEVFNQYQALAQEAGVEKSLVVVGNKVANAEDKQFITEAIPPEQLIGFLTYSPYLQSKEREGGAFDVTKLESENQKLLEKIEIRLRSARQDPDTRLILLHDLHKRYMAQASITERFGDLTDQIDPDFSFTRFST